MSNTTYIAAGAALVVGLLGGNLLSGGDDGHAEREAMRKALAGLASSQSALSEQLDGLSTRVDAIGGGFDAVKGEIGAQVAALGEGVSSDLTGLGGQISAGFGEIAQRSETSASAMKEELATLIESSAASTAARISEMTVQAPAAAAIDAGVADTADSSAAAPASAAPANGTGPGATAVLADGALRAFVSRVDSEHGEAVLFLNGTTDWVYVAEGSAVRADAGDLPCLLSLDAISGGTAELSALCGDDMPPPVGTQVGSTASFEEGALRVFVAGAFEQDGVARLALNGFDTEWALVGDVLEDDHSGCALRVDNVDRGHVAMTANCN